MKYDKKKRRERYLKNRERDIEYGKQYYQDNIDRVKLVKHIYYMINREKIIKRNILNRQLKKQKGQNESIKSPKSPKVSQNATEKQRNS